MHYHFKQHLEEFCVKSLSWQKSYLLSEVFLFMRESVGPKCCENWLPLRCQKTCSKIETSEITKGRGDKNRICDENGQLLMSLLSGFEKLRWEQLYNQKLNLTLLQDKIKEGLEHWCSLLVLKWDYEQEFVASNPGSSTGLT